MKEQSKNQWYRVGSLISLEPQSRVKIGLWFSKASNQGSQPVLWFLGTDSFGCTYMPGPYPPSSSKVQKERTYQP
jgi:hypothetical protein